MPKVDPSLTTIGDFYQIIIEPQVSIPMVHSIYPSWPFDVIVMDRHWFRTENQILQFTPERTRFFEISSPSANALPKFEHGFLRPEETEGWLQDSHVRASAAFSTLRVLFGECRQTTGTRIDATSSRYNVVPFSKAKFEKIADAFHVPFEFVWALEDPSGQVAKFRHLDKDGGDSTWCE